MPRAERFDLGGLYRAVDANRVRRGLSWSGLAREVGVAASTIRRFERADDAEADGVLTLVAWLGAAPEEFVVGDPGPSEALPPLDGGVIRVDTTLLADLSIGARSPRPGGRTTIQRLATTAQSCSRSIASFARHSAV